MPSLHTIFDLALVIAAFTAIIVIHELGHFLAARWAGIRVLAFAVGFGPAAVSWRKGLGWRRGSSENEYLALLEARGGHARNGIVGGVHPTEYRFNILPLGGYVKMLGQDDGDPTQRSDEPDSYQSCIPWKRMIVISAGVIANVVSAAILFVIVFGIGLRDVIAKVGDVQPGSPAALAVAINAAPAGVTEPGVKTGDRVLTVDGEVPDNFGDVAVASAMSAPGAKVELVVERPGVVEPLRFHIEPREDPASRFRSLGFGPAFGGRVLGAETRLTREQRSDIAAAFERLGVHGVLPGMRLSRVGDLPASTAGATPYDIDLAAKASGGRPVAVTFRDEAGKETSGTVQPSREFSTQPFHINDTIVMPLDHVLGLVPVMSVRTVLEHSGGEKAGLKAGDVFARLGDAEWPSMAEGIAEIRRPDRTRINIVVSRPGPDGRPVLVELQDVPVKKGIIGFGQGTTIEESATLARWPLMRSPPPPAVKPDAAAPRHIIAERPSGARLDLPPGSIVRTVNGTRVSSLGEVRDVLQSAAALIPPGPMAVSLIVDLPYAAGPATQQIEWTITESERTELAKLSWESPVPLGLFELEHILIKATNPGDAIGRGLKRTKMVMLNVYVTFARLVQGTVRVEHLQGPIGIAHAGTILAERGYLWVLFFMALVSVNLAVINFLPMPIVDGGHFLFLLYEQFTGRPVSMAFQSLTTLIGLVMIGSLFLLVTYNDLSRLLWQ